MGNGQETSGIDSNIYPKNTKFGFNLAENVHACSLKLQHKQNVE